MSEVSEHLASWLPGGLRPSRGRTLPPRTRNKSHHSEDREQEPHASLPLRTKTTDFHAIEGPVSASSVKLGSLTQTVVRQIVGYLRGVEAIERNADREHLLDTANQSAVSGADREV
jgi:hypothetical protein